MTAVESRSDADSAAGSRRPAGPRPTAAAGVALFPAEFELIIADVRAQIEALAHDEPFVTMGAPPVIARSTVEQAGYVREFPHMLGTVHTFQDPAATWLQLRPEAKPGGDWHHRQRVTDVVLTPAACYHIYPHVAGTQLDASLRFGIESYCYRHEGSSEVGRLRSFRMRELVYIGAPDDCVAWRDHWRERVASWLAGLGLDVRSEVASDPFFGPGARLMRDSQVRDALKLELTVPVAEGQRQAVASANCHKDHFGATFDITTAAGQVAHSACTAFGLERIALALVHARTT
jgi:seryl-tRNA synthetase